MIGRTNAQFSEKRITSSYAILTDDTRVDFEMDNTPMSNLVAAGTSTTLNGTLYEKTTIKEITFGKSYRNVTSIDNFFLYNCSALTSLDLNAFSNITSIGGNFMQGCSNLTSLDLSAFSNITSIGNGFLYGCSKLTQFKIGAISVPQTVAAGFLGETTALTTILVPMQSVQAYKTTVPWSNHASKISGY